MILQTDSYLNKDGIISFSESGCALFCLTEWAVKKGFYEFNKELFYHDCITWINRGIIDHEAYVLSWDKLCEALNLPYRIVIEGSHKLQRQPGKEEFQLLHLLNPATGFKHFCNADNRDNVTYDPLGESKTAKAYFDRKGTIVSRRIFERVI